MNSEDTYFRVKIRSVRSRANKKNLDFDLNIDWMRKNRVTICPILKTKLIYVKGAGISLPPENTPSIDRIDPDRGYTQDNCRIISYKANALLSNATLDQLEKVYLSLKEDCSDPGKTLKNSKLCKKSEIPSIEVGEKKEKILTPLPKNTIEPISIEDLPY